MFAVKHYYWKIIKFICLLSFIISATAKFKLEVASSGAPLRCDRNVYGGELECGRAYIKSYLSGERYDVHWDNPVAIATDQYQGWDMLSGIWTVNEKQNPHDIIILRLYNQHKNNNVFYDDVKIVPLSGKKKHNTKVQFTL